MKKILITLLIFFLVFPAFAQEYKLTQGEINKFLSIASDFISIAEEIGAQAREGMDYNGTYKINGNTINITFAGNCPFSNKFCIQYNDTLVAGNKVLRRQNIRSSSPFM